MDITDGVWKRRNNRPTTSSTQSKDILLMPFPFGRRKKRTADDYRNCLKEQATVVQDLINPILKEMSRPEIGAEGTLFQLSDLFDAYRDNQELRKNSAVDGAFRQLFALVDRFREDYPNFDDTPKDKNQPKLWSKLLSTISSTLNRANNSDVLPNNQNVTGTPNNPDLGSVRSNQSVPSDGGGKVNRVALTEDVEPSQGPNPQQRANPTPNPRHDVPSTKNSWGPWFMRMAAIAATVVSTVGFGHQYSQNQALQKQLCNGLETQGGVLEELVRQGGSKGSPEVAALTNEIRGNLGISQKEADEAFSQGGLPGLETLTESSTYKFGCGRG